MVGSEADKMSDTEFTIELRDWLIAQIRSLDTRIKSIDESLANSNWHQFEPTPEEELEEQKRREEANCLWRERQVYVAVWRKAMRELELDKFLREVQEWLPQGQTR